MIVKDFINKLRRLTSTFETKTKKGENSKDILESSKRV